MKRKLIFIMLFCMVLVSGCGKKGHIPDHVDKGEKSGYFDDILAESEGAGVSGNMMSVSQESLQQEQPRTSQEEFDEGMSEMDEDLRANTDLYSSYDVDSDEGIERDEDGLISFHIDNVTFVYSQDIDIQLLTQEDSNCIFVKGLDDVGSTMSIGVYDGYDFSDQCDMIYDQGRVKYDVNGNEYWTMQNSDGSTWYYLFIDKGEEDVKIVLVNSTGNFAQAYLDVCFPLPLVYED